MISTSKPFVLQDVFLNAARRERTNVKIRLMDGLELNGTVRGFDNFTVIVDSVDGVQSMLYKHAIAAVIPANGGGIK